jgi:hypothetical protein
MVYRNYVKRRSQSFARHSWKCPLYPLICPSPSNIEQRRTRTGRCPSDQTAQYLHQRGHELSEPNSKELPTESPPEATPIPGVTLNAEAGKQPRRSITTMLPIARGHAATPPTDTNTVMDQLHTKKIGWYRFRLTGSSPVALDIYIALCLHK